MKLLSPELEKLAIKSITKGDVKVSSALLANLDDSCFNWEPTQEAWARLNRLTKKTGEIPHWDDLINDPTISQENRKLLQEYTKKPIQSKEKGEKIASRLQQYAQIRGIYDLAQYSAESIKADKVDTESLIEKITDHLTKIKTKGIKTDIFTNWGTNSNSKRVVKDILFKKDDRKYIPLGIKAFDDVNVGLPRGGFTVIAANSGGGKSALSVYIAMKMARWGAKVAVVSLEMSKEEVGMRQLACLTKIDMGRILRQDLSKKDTEYCMEKYRRFTKKCKRSGGMLSVVTPEDDVTMEEILILLKPYAYDAVIIDYISLLKGMDEEDQWRKLGAAGRFGKRFASANNMNVIICAQLGDDGIIRYSRALKEHSSNMLSWRFTEDSAETGLVTVHQQKARNQRAFPFQLKVDFSTMTFESVEEPDERETSKTASQAGLDLED